MTDPANVCTVTASRKKYSEYSVDMYDKKYAYLRMSSPPQLLTLGNNNRLQKPSWVCSNLIINKIDYFTAVHESTLYLVL